MDLIKQYSGDTGDSAFEDDAPIVNVERESRAERSKKRNSGESYTTSKNKEVSARECKPLRLDCRKECRLKINREPKKYFHFILEPRFIYDGRVSFVEKLIKIKPKARVRQRNSSEKTRTRKFTVTYCVPVESDFIEVCQKCFLRSLGESEKFVAVLSNKMWDTYNNVNAISSRGKSSPKNKLSSDKIEEVKAHNYSIPAYESHYGRSHSNKKYLQSNLNLQKLYNLYREPTTNPVSLSSYKKIFMRTGLKFKSPQIDTCHKCDSFQAKIKYETNTKVIDGIRILQKQHQNEAEIAYQSKNINKETAEKDDNKSTIVCSFDLQQCLPTPKLNTSVSFYKRPLWTHATSYYMWHEAVAKRGANEIASCLDHYIQNLPIIPYSDNYSGQNKNKMTLAMFLNSIQDHPSLETIDHKFLVTGHTHMESDSDHATIERAKKTNSNPIQLPDDWYKLVNTAGKKKSFDVQIMNQKDFYNYEQLFKKSLVLKKKDSKGNLFSMNAVKWLRYTKTFGKVLYKNNLSEEEPFHMINFERSSKIQPILRNELKIFYEAPIPISKEKKKI